MKDEALKVNLDEWRQDEGVKKPVLRKANTDSRLEENQQLDSQKGSPKEWKKDLVTDQAIRIPNSVAKFSVGIVFKMRYIEDWMTLVVGCQGAAGPLLYDIRNVSRAKQFHKDFKYYMTDIDSGKFQFQNIMISCGENENCIKLRELNEEATKEHTALETKIPG